MAKFVDEDLGPDWLRDYNSIQADLSCVRDFAHCLHAELEVNYLPHRERVSADMTTPVASPASEFGELCGFLDTHWQSQVLTNALLAEYANATNALALAATAISDAYRDVDGQAMARSRDVAALLGAEPPVRAVPNGGTAGSAA